MLRLGVIGGTGLDALPGFVCERSESVSTPYGTPSANLLQGRLQGHELAFLARHGAQHTIAPHKVNYRANIWALKQSGITDVIAVAAVGGISAELAPSTLVVPDQIVDYTYGRLHTFYEDESAPLTHVDFTHPYCPKMRERLIEAAAEVDVVIVPQGVYGATQGPRLESTAEIDRMERDGCTIVGMTGMPEAGLAREAELGYAHFAVVVNEAAGRGPAGITMAAIRANMETGMERLLRVLAAVAQGMAPGV